MRGNIDHPTVPVIMYHSVSEDPNATVRPWLCTPLWLMELILTYVRKSGYSTITLSELYNYLDHGERIPKHSLVLTFDDGYLDNWVYLYPLLKRYGMKAVVWVSSDFVERSSKVRPTLEDVWENRIDRQSLEVDGYLSEGELRIMQKSGVFEVGSHCKSHARIFTSARIVDFQNPRSNYYWLAWNHHPECRLTWIKDSISGLIPLGTPIYNYGWATCNYQYLHDVRLDNYLVNYVEERRGPKFFLRKNWKSILFRQSELWRSENSDQGRFETYDELRKRLWTEVTEPKTYLEHVLGHSIDFLCWPGGGSSRLGISIAREATYLATTVRSPANKFGKRPDMIDRVSIRFLDFPILKQFLNLSYFKYVVGHTERRFPYFHFWCLQRLIRRKDIFRSVEISNSDDLVKSHQLTAQ